MKDFSADIEKIKEALNKADAVVIGAGAGLSTAAGFSYAGERFSTFFRDFQSKYTIKDMYSGGFYPFPSTEEFWGFMSRLIYVNRYMDAPKDTYDRLFDLVRYKDYFVITTNVDHCFQKAGFDKKRLFYTQGDYGLFQCKTPCTQKTYDNMEQVTLMLKDQNIAVDESGKLKYPEAEESKTAIASEHIPICPVCGEQMTVNLRSDERFVEDEGWHQANERYYDFLSARRNTRIVFFEIGVGFNTPMIIKYPFWQMTNSNSNARYISLNMGDIVCPPEISERSICIDADADQIIRALQ